MMTLPYATSSNHKRELYHFINHQSVYDLVSLFSSKETDHFMQEERLYILRQKWRLLSFML